MGEDFLIDWMWGVRKERSWGRWHECLEGEDTQGTEQEFNFGLIELEMDKRHSADLRRSGRAVHLGVSISLEATLSPQG